ncbi:MAG: oligosaccharide flippase family protein [Desulfobacterales bacterium]|nr:oligosaccharide flippase family protein [Desulfobacterales bacterium]
MSTPTLSTKTTILIISKTITSVINFLSGLILARYLTKSDYATYSQIMLIGSTSAIVTVGVQQGLFYFIPLSEEKHRRSIAINGLFLGIILILIPLLIFFFFKKQISLSLNNEKLYGLWTVAILYIFSFSIAGFTDSVLINFNKVNKLAIINIMTSILIIIPIILVKNDIKIIVCCVALSYFFMFICNLIFLGDIKLLCSININEMRSQMEYAFPIMISSVLGIIGRRIDQYMISIMFTPEDYAIYTRGAFDIPFIDIITSSIFTILIPELTTLIKNNEYSQSLKLWRDAVYKIALLSFPLAIFLIVMAKPLMIFLFSEKYIESAPIFRVYSLFLILQIAIYGTIPRVTGRTDIIYKMAILLSCTNILINYPLIKIFGPIGASIGTISASFAAILYILSKNATLLKTSLSHIFPWKRLFQILIISLICSVVLFLPFLRNMGAFIQLSLGFLSYAIMVAFIYGTCREHLKPW